MSLLRRRKTDSVSPEEPVAKVTAPAVVQTAPNIERALLALTSKMQSCIDRLETLEHRLDELTDNVAHVPSHSDVLEVRIHSAKLAAELARATVELRGEIGMASDEARRAARLARSNEQEDVPVALPVDLDLTTEERKDHKWSESA